MTKDTSDDLAAAFDIEGDLPDSVDGAALERMRTVAWLLDESVRVPGTKFRVGIDPLLGVVPGAGDVLGAGLSMYIVLESARLGVTYTTLVRMLANVAVDTAGGSIPYVGDVFDAFWKANDRNFRLALADLAESDGASPEDPVEIDVE